MSIPKAAPGIPVDLFPQDGDAPGLESRALVKTNEFEAIRIAVPKGGEVCSNHQVEGPITVQCLKGRVAFTADGDVHSLRAGQWLFLPGRVPHSITGVEDSLILLTVMFPQPS